MSKGFTITEETPDRNYFTIVPNYIVNHSTIYEQGIYLVMKRIAGENGRCYASHQIIADKAGISRPTVSKTIQKLIKRNWIKETGIKGGRTASTKEYQIVDLWELNNKFYKDEKIRQPQNISTENKEAVNQGTAYKGKLSTTEQLSCKPPLHKEEHIQEDKNISINHTNGAKPQFGNPDINICLEELTKLLGSTPAKETLNRYAVKRLITKLGNVDRVLAAINYAFKIREEDRYAPRIYNFMDLEEKLEHLKGYGKQKTKSKSVNVEEGIAYLENKKVSGVVV